MVFAESSSDSSAGVRERKLVLSVPSQNIKFLWALFFRSSCALTLLNRLRILCSGLFEVGASITLPSTRVQNVGLSEIFSLSIFFAKSDAALRAHPSWCMVSLCDLSSNFGAQGLRSWGGHLLDNSSRRTLSFPNLNLVPGAFGEFDGVFWSQSSLFMWNRSSRIRIFRYTTQLCRLLKYSWSFCTTFRSPFAGFSTASTCLKKHFFPYMHPFSDLQFWHGRMPKFTWRFFVTTLYRHGISLLLSEVPSSLLPDFFFPFVSLCLRICGRQRSSFWSLTCLHLPEATVSWLKLHESPLEHCPCAFHGQHFTNFPAGFFPFLTLGDWSSFHNFVPNREVSSSHHLINTKFYSRLQS